MVRIELRQVSGGSRTLGRPNFSTDTKSWSLASRNAAIPPQRSTSSSPASCCSRFTALGFVNGHLFLSSATKICPNFSNQTTMFLEKNTDLCLPICGPFCQLFVTVRIDWKLCRVLSEEPSCRVSSVRISPLRMFQCAKVVFFPGCGSGRFFVSNLFLSRFEENYWILWKSRIRFVSFGDFLRNVEDLEYISV